MTTPRGPVLGLRIAALSLYDRGTHGERGDLAKDVTMLGTR